MIRRALVACAVLLAGAAPPTVQPIPTVAAAPLPATRLEFGLSNLDIDWMKNSGVPWGYRFQYLAGGVNTTGNWLTWQDMALPPGQFAVDYMASSTTAPANYIPVFTWYQLLQSLPSTGASELDRDYSNLNNASTMSSYYSSFKILMQKAGAYGRQVVVHVEPDFWGYMQQKAEGGAASSVSARVRSSGFAEAAAFPDNLVGFASELKYLRDTYAPDALLAVHASMWSSSIDIASNTSPNVNPTAEADKTAAFLNSTGTWDAVFNDVDDHNAAWWELASCGSPPCVNQYFTHWWDPSNVKFPNFARYLTWVGELHNRTALPQVVWQVPMGNQYFLTMNNTCGHFQDNVAPYFIKHADQLFNAGLIAVLFGPANDCQTDNEDARQDGTTNNGGRPTTDTLGGCNACNTNTSTWPDDDGGYLRIFVGGYYAGQLPCTGVGLNVAPASPRQVGTEVTVTANATGCSNLNPLYRFAILSPGASAYQLAQAYSSSPTHTWNTTGLIPGTYRFSVWALDAQSPGVYGNTAGRWDAYNNSLTYRLTSCSSVAVSAAPGLAVEVGTAVTLTSNGSGCAIPLYRVSVLAPGASTYQLLQDYTTATSFGWNTAGLVPGDYRFSVWVRDAGSRGLSGNGAGRWDAYNNNTVVNLTPCNAVAVTAAPPSPGTRGTLVTLTAAASGCSNPIYRFAILAPGATGYQLVQGYSSGTTFTWNTTGLPPGSYRFSIWAMDADSAGASGNSAGRWDTCNNASVYTLT